MEIEQVYIASFENLIGNPIIENGKIVGGIEMANNKKFIPLIWTKVYYDKIPTLFKVTDSKENLLALLLNFKQKTIFTDRKEYLPIVNYEEIINHWEDMKEWGGKLWDKTIPIHRANYTIKFERIGKGWKAFFEKSSSDGITVHDFIKEYVSQAKFNFSDVYISFTQELKENHIENFFIANRKISVSDFLIEEIYYNEKLLNLFYEGYNLPIRLKLKEEYLRYENKEDKCFVDEVIFSFNQK